MSTIPIEEVPTAGPSTQYPPSPAFSEDFTSSAPSSPIPIRSTQDYSSDSDDDDLVYAQATAPSTTRTPKHRPRPSTSALLPTAATDSLDLARPDRPSRLREEYGVDLEEVAEVPETRTRGWEKSRALLKRNEGFLLIGLSQMFMAVINTCVKLLTEEVNVPTWEIIVIRMSITWLGCYTYMRTAGVEYPFLGPPGVRHLLVMRGMIGFLGLFGTYFSLKYLSLSDATVLQYLSPILVGFLAAILLKETYSKQEALTGLSSLGGVFLIAKPSFLFPASSRSETVGPGGSEVTVAQREMAVGVALMGVLGSAGAYLSIRKIGTRANALHSIAYFSLYSTIVASLYPIFFNSPPVFNLNARFFAFISILGVLGLIAQILLTMGLQREKAGRGTLAVYTNIIFTLTLELAVFHNIPDLFSLVGTSIIIGGAIFVALDKGRRSKEVTASVEEEEGESSMGLVGKETKSDLEEEEEEGLGGKSVVVPAASGSGDVDR